MFGRDPITPIAKLLEPRLKFYGEKGVSLRMDTLCKLYTVAAENIRRAREKHPWQKAAVPRFQVNDLVLVKDQDSAVFEPRYMPNYRIVAIHGKNRIEVQDEKGHKSIRRLGHVCHQLPSQEVYEQYGRTSKLLIHARDIPHIPLEVFREQRQIEKSEDHNIELSLIDSQKEFLIDNHGKSRSQVGNENLVEDPMKDQSTVQVCILEVHSERDTMQPSLMVPKGEVSKKNSGHSLATPGNSIEIDTSDDSKNRCQEIVTGAWKGESGESRTDHMEKSSDIDTGDDSTSRLQTKEQGIQCKHGAQFTKLNNDDDVDTGVEVRIQLQGAVLTVTQEGPEHNHRYVDNTDASKSRQMNQENRVSKWSSDCKASRQGVQLLTLKKFTVDIDSCEESRRQSNRCCMSVSRNAHQLVTSVNQNRCIESTTVNKHDNNIMGNQWLSSALSKFTSSILRKSNEGKVDNISVDSNPNSTSILNSDFNFFL